MLHLHESGPRDQATRGSIAFIHGFPFDGSMWRPQLDALPDGWRGLAPDLRGFGRSPMNGEVPETATGKRLGGGIAHEDEPVLTMARLADDVANLIERECDDGPAVVCGLSMGGYVAFELLRRHPGSVRGLILADTRAEADSDEARENRLLMAQTARSSGTRPIAASMIPSLLTDSTRESRPDVVAQVRELILGTPVTTLIAALAGMAGRHDSTGDLAGITVPTRVVVGESDAITPLDSARRMADGIPGADLVVIPDAAHLSSLENPGAFNEATSVFLDGL